MNEQLVFPENAAVSVGEHVQLPAAHEEKLAERMLVVLRFIAFGKLKKCTLASLGTRITFSAVFNLNSMILLYDEEKTLLRK